MGKQMEGDNRERRKKGREAREEGNLPSEDKATSGASKQRHHRPDSDEHDEKMDTLREGKQGGGVQKHLPDRRPRDVYGGREPRR